jgi:hypothetical protein
LPPASLRADIRFGRQSCVPDEIAVTFTLAWLARSKAMSTRRSRRLQVAVTHLPVTRCQLCDRILAYRPGNISEVLTERGCWTVAGLGSPDRATPRGTASRKKSPHKEHRHNKLFCAAWYGPSAHATRPSRR